jgi:hypothetical protein
MQRNRRLPQRPERRRNGCLITLVILVWVVLGALLVYQYYLRPRISQQIGEQIGRQLGVVPTARPGDPQPAPGSPNATSVAGVLPTLVASLPSGEIRVTEADANAYMTANIDQLQPIESVTLRFVPGEIQADLVALGSTSTARMGAAIQGGQIIALSPQIEGPLSNLVDLQDLIGPLQRQLNDELQAQGRRVTDVRIETGVLIFMVE